MKLEERVGKVSQGLPGNAMALRNMTRKLAHDFNNVLAIIYTNLELIEEDLEKESLEHQLCLSALEAAQSGAALTAEILNTPSALVAQTEGGSSGDQGLNLEIKSCRILFIESDHDRRNHGCEVLSEMGHIPITADNANAGLHILEIDHGFDLVITDIMLAGGNSGVSFARSAKDILPDIGIIFMSNYTTDATGMKMNEVAGARMVASPLIPLEVAMAIQHVYK